LGLNTSTRKMIRETTSLRSHRAISATAYRAALGVHNDHRED
jgi:hypothetical protein